ncbi:putative arsenite efflux transporter -like [Pyrenophora seminiperda CCB06]|uniref:Putative arsenite efflux transporter-like n=1 Tax=Pyrenophora seminiperda CCB06 TaxID=1302712 RepID=A0A3M7LYK2_9PLEO|nr:putative arsenite efflux transporter -like [Pyrenophora seminiperda CCB06]
MFAQRATDETERPDLDTGKIKEWRSIITLIVFVLTNINVLFPFHIPIYAPRILWTLFLNTCSALRIIPPAHHPTRVRSGKVGAFVRFNFPMNFITAPLIADLFLLAILAIGKREVSGGTLGDQGIVPYDIMLFFLSLAYIAISVDASGLIRWLAFKVLQKGGKVGHRLFFYLYAFFFLLTMCIGNDPIILSGTAFLSYMTRVSSNIKHPRAWIFTQFSVANIASAILVSSNPTNLVLAGAFKITFIKYTANIIVPVLVTGVVLYPFLLYIIFHDESLIPSSIKMEDLPDELKNKKPVNPNIPYAKGAPEDSENNPDGNNEEEKVMGLEEILNPFLDKSGAMFGAAIMAATLVTVLAINAASQRSHERPVFWVTLPAATVMLIFDLTMGWRNREETRKIAHEGRRKAETALAEREEARRRSVVQESPDMAATQNGPHKLDEKPHSLAEASNHILSGKATESSGTESDSQNGKKLDSDKKAVPSNLSSIISDRYRWAQETFPTTMTVFHHLPLPLVPFAFCMFVLVQALVTKGWVPVFAHAWDHWVEKTGTVGAIGGMGFISVILCNFAGTNIGTTILISRVVQAWQEIHVRNGIPISDRTFWGTIYSMAIGVNYGAFSLAFSASLAGMLWRDILGRKHIHVGGLEFARVNLPIIAITMVVGLVVLIGEIYIMRTDAPYS